MKKPGRSNFFLEATPSPEAILRRGLEQGAKKKTMNQAANSS